MEEDDMETLQIVDALISKLQTVREQYSSGKHIDAYRTAEEMRKDQWWLLDCIESAVITQKSDDSDLTEEEEQKLIALNNILVELEKKIQKESEKIAANAGKG